MKLAGAIRFRHAYKSTTLGETIDIGQEKHASVPMASRRLAALR